MLSIALWLVPFSGARAQVIGEGFELERSGQGEKAAELYFATLRADPTNLPALLGLERVLPLLNRLPEMLPYAQRAVAADSTRTDLQALLLRLYLILNEPDSARAMARRWTQARPGDEAPYREWAIALEDVAAYDAAREVLLDGRQALRRPAAFAIELGELYIRIGQWVPAAKEWGLAVTALPAQIPNAAAQLSEAPQETRGKITDALASGSASLESRRVAAELLLEWGDPARAWEIFAPTAASHTPENAYALHRFADLAAAPGTPAAWQVRGQALVRFAEIVPVQLAIRARSDAARAFLEAGDAASARAQLEYVAADSTAPSDAQDLAQATLIGALIKQGQLDSAALRLAHVAHDLPDSTRSALRFELARARIRQGQLALAESALANDSSVAALALYSRIALYQGDLARARSLIRQAGPYTGDRHEATERAALLALIARIPDARAPELGSALLELAQGDSSGAVKALKSAADHLPPEAGGAEALLFAGRVAAQLGDKSRTPAASLFEEAMKRGGQGSAPPAAELAWAELLIRQGKNPEAIQHLEHLILTYPGSAVVPEARRQLELAKGAIPKS
ncbi:MAG TPA: hypothetical protein VLV45_10890 [Gemmatimonadales bacterium]|nr:hypothetical protein [Gemmatimonadales bacterium]